MCMRGCCGALGMRIVMLKDIYMPCEDMLRCVKKVVCAAPGSLATERNMPSMSMFQGRISTGLRLTRLPLMNIVAQG
jgi:hypothetical protein